MFSWVTNWWSSESFTGPARNAPNQGINIKYLFDQRPKQVIVVTDDQIKSIMAGLKKIEPNSTPPESQDTPIMKELDDVFKRGNKNFFESLAIKSRASNISKQCDDNLCEDNVLEERSEEDKILARNKVVELMKKKRENLQLQMLQNNNSLEEIKKRNAENRIKRLQMKADENNLIKPQISSDDNSMDVSTVITHNEKSDDNSTDVGTIITHNEESSDFQQNKICINDNVTSLDVEIGADEFTTM